MPVIEFIFLLLILLMDFASSGANIWTWALSQPFEGQGMANHPQNLHQKPRVTQGYVPCLNDRGCGRGRFCDRHYGTCDLHRREGQPCRRDGHCVKTLICMYGRCVKPVSPPLTGSRCKHNSDCGTNMCCAKRHGERVCKPRLLLGQRCYVPRGGLDYSLNEICPCEGGLVCRIPEIGLQEQLHVTASSNYERMDFRRMRCAPP